MALGLYSLGFSTGVTTSLFIAGTTTVSWAGLAMAWLVTQKPQSQVSEIDKIKEILIDAAKRAQEAVGEGSGHAHGSRVHAAFAEEVKALGRSDLISEVSYQNGQPKVYGSTGTIRVDVVYGTKENPIAIFDLKTGNASLTVTRINQIRSHLPLLDVPIFEVKQ